MGWSATVAACKTLDKIEDRCVKLTGMANVFLSNGNKYFIEVGDEQEDGSIHGEIIDYFTQKVVSKLVISPSGDLVEGKYLKRLIK